MTPHDHHARFLAALNDGPRELVGWPVFDETRFGRTLLQRDANLATMWKQCHALTETEAAA